MYQTWVCQVVVLYAVIGLVAAIPSAMELFKRVKRDESVHCVKLCTGTREGGVDEWKKKYTPTDNMWEDECRVTEAFHDCVTACAPSKDRTFFMDYSYPYHHAVCSAAKGVAALAEPKQCLAQKCESVDKTCNDKCTPKDSNNPTESPDTKYDDIDAKRRAVASLYNRTCPKLLCEGECVFKTMRHECGGGEMRLAAPLLALERGMQAVCNVAAKDMCLLGAGAKVAINGRITAMVLLFAIVTGWRGTFGGGQEANI